VGLYGGEGGGVPLLETLEDRGPFASAGNLESGEGSRIPVTLNDEWRRTLGMGHLFPSGLHEGDLEGGLIYWAPREICYVRLRNGDPFLANIEGRPFLWAF